MLASVQGAQWYWDGLRASGWIWTVGVEPVRHLFGPSKNLDLKLSGGSELQSWWSGKNVTGTERQKC